MIPSMIDCRRWITAIALALLAATEAAAQSGAASETLRRLDWLAGCWQRGTGARIVEEQWMAPRATVMLGMSRTVNNGTLVEYEQLRLSANGSTVTYAAAPSGQAPAEFTSTVISDSLAVFSNPAHDFPQSIIYRRRGRDSLVARIEGVRDGRTSGVDFPYARVACPGPRQ